VRRARKSYFCLKFGNTRLNFKSDPKRDSLTFLRDVISRYIIGDNKRTVATSSWRVEFALQLFFPLEHSHSNAQFFVRKKQENSTCRPPFKSEKCMKRIVLSSYLHVLDVYKLFTRFQTPSEACGFTTTRCLLYSYTYVKLYGLSENTTFPTCIIVNVFFLNDVYCCPAAMFFVPPIYYYYYYFFF